MLIREIDHRDFEFKDGLKPLHLKGLNNIVVLAGPNGAGKTRVLRRVRATSGSRVDKDNNKHAFSLMCESMKWTMPPYAVDEPKFTLNIPELYGKDDPKRDLWERMNGLKSPRDTRALGVTLERHPADYNWTNRTDLSDILYIHHYGTSEYGLKDSADLSHNDRYSRYRDCESIGLHRLPESATSYIQHLQNMHREATHPEYLHSEKQQHILTYETLNDTVFAFLGTRLERDHLGIATINGKDLAHARLSDGQIMLLFLAISMHAHGSAMSNAILTIDEPENHLHPEAMLASFDRIVKCTTNGQLWIATHSIPLLAHIHDKYRDSTSLIFMEDSTAYYAGRAPDRVLNSLMGGAENMLSLRAFLDLPITLAMNTFASECLNTPLPVEFKEADPQCELALSTISDPSFNGKYKILDYGAGQCRLLDALVAKYDSTFNDVVDYFAYEQKSNEELSKNTISKYYTESPCRLFTDKNGLFEKHASHSFDVVILCNVLHEISPSKWLSMFNPDGEIPKCLKDDGYLLVIEDYLMMQGECANEYGFIVLNGEAIRDLFCICDSDKYVVKEATGVYRDRIRAHRVPARCLTRITPETRVKALRATKKTAKDKIEAIRTTSPRDYKSGLQHAFWVQQYANAHLALEDLSGH